MTIIEILDFKIDKANFDKWLKENDRLKWESDTVNHLGEHEHKTGEIEVDIYWLLEHREIIEGDIMDYIRMNGDNPVGTRSLMM